MNAIETMACAVPDRFRAWMLARHHAGVQGQFVELGEADLDDGDVLIEVAYASVARREALAASGLGPPTRRLPCVGGTDLAGIVLASAAPRFKPGDRVMATGYGLGVKHHGAYAERALLPGGWVMPVPEVLSMQEAMVLGSIGLAVALSITRLEDNGLKPERGPVLVTGATGNCGALAVAMLAVRGYEVVAVSRRAALTPWLHELGAARVLPWAEVGGHATRPPVRSLWAGAVDHLGGEMLGWIVASAKPGAGVVALGDVAEGSCQLALGPVVRHGVSVLGVDSVQAGFATREAAWARLSGDLRTRKLALLYRMVGFEELPLAFEQLLGGQTRGRTVVRIADRGSEKEGI